MKNRREFIKSILVGGAFIGLSSISSNIFSNKNTNKKNSYIKIIILHTNDTHSRIDPYPYSDPKYGGMGGFARRAAIINKIREENKNVLLFDAGDIYQGSPYFNEFGGELELKLMSKMGYNAAAIGNHEFDNGLSGIDNKLQFANFPFICSNYDFSHTILNNKIKKWAIFTKDGVKIGVYGLGVELEGLVNKDMYENTIYLSPVNTAIDMENYLKKTHKCDFIICLSHLGFDTKEKANDLNIASETNFTDLIIGGHTHTFLDEPVRIKNKQDANVHIVQVGSNGVKLGRVNLMFDKTTGEKLVESNTIKIFKSQA